MCAQSMHTKARSVTANIQLLQLITSLSNNDFLHPETHYLF